MPSRRVAASGGRGSGLRGTVATPGTGGMVSPTHRTAASTCSEREKGPPTEEEGWAALDVVSAQCGNRTYNVVSR